MPLLHPFPPVFDASSKVLILGSFPSVASRAEGFYYGHPQNRFWRVMAHVLSAPVPMSIAEKREMLLSRGVALWDVAAACKIKGSLDSNMRGVVLNDLSVILDHAPIRAVFLNGAQADKLYRGHDEIARARLPSTSPANAVWTLERLEKAWADAIRPYVGNQ